MPGDSTNLQVAWDTSHVMERLAGGQALPDSWLNTLLCRNAHTLKAGGQPTGAGSTEDRLPGDPQHTCSEQSFRGPQALRERWSFFQQSTSMCVPVGGFSSLVTQTQNGFGSMLWTILPSDLGRNHLKTSMRQDSYNLAKP